jgi:hypothetical protein
MRRIPLLLLVGCAPLHFSGASFPIEHTVGLTEMDISAARSTTCLQAWIGPDPGPNRAEALKRLEARGVRISERRVLPWTTAFAGELRVGAGFWEKPLAEQSTILSHELVHYCQRDRLGNAVFVETWENSPGRWALKMPAHVQTILTMKAQGTSEPALEAYIDKRIMTMRDFYLLWDLDQKQYLTVTREIWEESL